MTKTQGELGSIENCVVQALNEIQFKPILSNFKSLKKKQNEKSIKILYKAVDKLNKNINSPQNQNSQLENIITDTQNKFRVANNNQSLLIRDEQKMSAIASYYSKKGIALDVKTGEGKTLISAMTARLHNEDGRNVDIFTANNKLAVRDYFDYKSYGVDVGLIIDKDTIVSEIKDFKTLENSFYNNNFDEFFNKLKYQISGQTNENSAFDALFKHENFNEALEISLIADLEAKIDFKDSLIHTLTELVNFSNRDAYKKKTIITTLSKANFDYQNQLINKDNESKPKDIRDLDMRPKSRAFDVLIADESDNNILVSNPHVITTTVENKYNYIDHKKILLESLVNSIKSKNQIEHLKEKQYYEGGVSSVVGKLFDRMNGKDDAKRLTKSGVLEYVKIINNSQSAKNSINQYLNNSVCKGFRLNFDEIKNNQKEFSQILYEFIKVKNTGGIHRKLNEDSLKKFGDGIFRQKTIDKLDKFLLNKINLNNIKIQGMSNIADQISTIHKAIHLQKDKDYFLNPDGKIILINKSSKEPLPNNSYKNNLQEAIKVLESGHLDEKDFEIKKVSSSYNSVDFANKYNKKILLSGSNELASHLTKDILDLDTISIPVHKYSKDYNKLSLEDVLKNNFRVCQSKDEKFNLLLNKIQESKDKSRSILIIGNENELSEFENILKSTYTNQVNKLTHHNSKDYDKIIQDAGLKGQVTLSTYLGARGANITPKDGSENLDVYVINANNMRELEQAIGRTNRKGNSGGHAEILISRDDNYLGSFENSNFNKIFSPNYITNLDPTGILDKANQKIAKEIFKYVLYSKEEQLKQQLKSDQRTSIANLIENAKTSHEISKIASAQDKLSPNVDKIYDKTKTLPRKLLDKIMTNSHITIPLTVGLGALATGSDLTTSALAAMQSELYCGLFKAQELHAQMGLENSLKKQGSPSIKAYQNGWSYVGNRVMENIVPLLTIGSVATTGLNTLGTAMTALITGYTGLQLNDAGEMPYQNEFRVPKLISQDKVKKEYQKRIKEY